MRMFNFTQVKTYVSDDIIVHKHATQIIMYKLNVHNYTVLGCTMHDM